MCPVVITAIFYTAFIRIYTIIILNKYSILDNEISTFNTSYRTRWETIIPVRLILI